MEIPKASADAFVTFTEYPPNGWLGYCDVDYCAEPRSVMLNFEYNAYTTQFWFFVTADAMNEAGDDVNADVLAYRDLYFTWVNWYSAEPETPDTDAVAGILNAIGANGAALTSTLLYRAAVDLDLYFSCPDGTLVGYGAPNNCGGVDIDMGAGSVDHVRGDGSIGQIENISLGEA